MLVNVYDMLRAQSFLASFKYFHRIEFTWFLFFVVCVLNFWTGVLYHLNSHWTSGVLYIPPKLTLNFWCTVPPKLTLGELKLLVYIKGGSRILESRVSPSVRNHALLGDLGIDCITLKSYIIYGLGACPPENFCMKFPLSAKQVSESYECLRDQDIMHSARTHYSQTLYCTDIG